MQLLTISMLYALLALIPSESLALLYDGESLDKVHFQPMARDIMYGPLSNIDTVNYQNLTEVYTRVIECNQMVAALKNEMVSKQTNLSIMKSVG